MERRDSPLHQASSQTANIGEYFTTISNLLTNEKREKAFQGSPLDAFVQESEIETHFLFSMYCCVLKRAPANRIKKQTNRIWGVSPANWRKWILVFS
jgi:hypothetical protein